jgi:pimeloyl-ACP methyl ester carboxylesterase
VSRASSFGRASVPRAAYFDPIAESLPGRAVAVDPPGFGRSASIGRNTRGRYADVAREVIESTGCTVMIGHSLGSYVALDVAAQPPVALRAVVMIDGLSRTSRVP